VHTKKGGGGKITTMPSNYRGWKGRGGTVSENSDVTKAQDASGQDDLVCESIRRARKIRRKERIGGKVFTTT